MVAVMGVLSCGVFWFSPRWTLKLEIMLFRVDVLMLKDHNSVAAKLRLSRALRIWTIYMDNSWGLPG